MYTNPTVTSNGDGTYTVEGMLFHMEMHWQIRVQVTRAGKASAAGATGAGASGCGGTPGVELVWAATVSAVKTDTVKVNQWFIFILESLPRGGSLVIPSFRCALAAAGS
jgi:hypothetical protein